MKNESAFTLVELIATILLLCLIALLTTTSISKAIRSNKKNSHDIQVNNILTATVSYVSRENSIKMSDLNNYTVTLKTLSDKGFIDSDIKDPLNGKYINLTSSYVTITKETDTSKTDNNSSLDYLYDGNYLYVLTIAYK